MAIYEDIDSGSLVKNFTKSNSVECDDISTRKEGEVDFLWGQSLEFLKYLEGEKKEIFGFVF